MGYWVDRDADAITLPAPLVPGATTELRFAVGVRGAAGRRAALGETGDVFMIALLVSAGRRVRRRRGWHTRPYRGTRIYMGLRV